MSISVWLFAGLSCIDHDDGDGLIDGEDHALVRGCLKVGMR